MILNTYISWARDLLAAALEPWCKWAGQMYVYSVLRVILSPLILSFYVPCSMH